MLTYEVLCNHALGLAQCDAPLPLVVQWASRRTHEFAGKHRLQSYKRGKELYLPAAVTAGTVTATRDSSIVLGNGAAQAAWALLGEPFPQGWFVRVASAWYRVAGKTATTLELESRFAENSHISSSYTLVKRYHSLAQDVLWFDDQSFILSRLGSSLESLSEEDLNRLYPQRWGIYSGGLSIPQLVCEVEPAADGSRQLEVYPYPSQSELISYLGWITPPNYTFADPLPPFIDMDTLVPGVLSDIYKWKANAQETKFDERQLYQNISARENTVWEAMKDQGVSKATGSKVTSVVVVRPGLNNRGRFARGITSAYDQVWSR